MAITARSDSTKLKVNEARKTQGKSIRLFLVDGSPLGLITGEISNWTGKVLSFPRGLLPDALNRWELAKTGVYFLIGSDPEGSFEKLVYIGKSDDIGQRLRQHDADENKSFYEQVVLFVSKDENLTTGHVNYLESRLIARAQSVGSAKLANSNKGSPVNLPESEICDMEYALEQLCVLMSTLGFSFLQELPQRQDHSGSDERTDPVFFELSYLGGTIQAKAYESEGRLIVLKGSTARHPSNAADCIVKGSTTRNFPFYSKKMQELMEQNKLVPVKGAPELLKFSEDVMFSSPSAASDVICGASTNGRNFWKVAGTSKTYGEWRAEQIEIVGNTRR